jgi:class 3 adenylate cyclase
MTAALACKACGAELRSSAKFCDECGSPIAVPGTAPAEYKQVTVLFADLVHSMDIAPTKVAERSREIMTELVNCRALVVRRYGGTPLAASSCAPSSSTCSKSLAGLDGFRHAVTGAVDREAGSGPGGQYGPASAR